MAEATTNPTSTTAPHRGQVLMQWEFPEYDKPERGLFWYVAMIGVGLLLLIYAISDANFLFALIVILFAFILFTHHRSEPLRLSCLLYERGIQIGEKFYLFRELDSFALIYEPPLVKKLYIRPKGAWLHHDIPIQLYDQDPVAIRALLVQYVTEDLEKESESTSEVIARVFKF